MDMGATPKESAQVHEKRAASAKEGYKDATSSPAKGTTPIPSRRLGETLKSQPNAKKMKSSAGAKGARRKYDNVGQDFEWRTKLDGADDQESSEENMDDIQKD